MTQRSEGTLVPTNREQSPIDIRRGDIADFGKLVPLRFTYDNKVDLKIVNKANDIKIELTKGTGEIALVGEAYTLKEIHFHTPSEHRLNGKEFEMEMHMVHKNAQDGLLVVGRWIVIGMPDDSLSKIFSVLPREPDDTAPVTDFDLNALLPAGRESFRYPGSLTAGQAGPTGDFPEGVQWIVFSEKMPLSEEQVGAFRAVVGGANRRVLQPINDRVILTDVI